MIDGLTITSDFIDRETERWLLFEIDAIVSTPRPDRGPHDSRTTIVRWGELVYANHHAHAEIPEWLLPIAARVPMDPPTSVTLNIWAPGDRLDPHIDKGGPVVCVLQLASAATIAFSGPYVEIYDVPARALLRMEGAARYDWEHACFPSEQHRISLVFRTRS